MSEDILRASDTPSKAKSKSTTLKASKDSKPKPQSSPAGERQGKAGRKPMSFRDYVSSLPREEVEKRHKLAKKLGLPDTWLAHRNASYIFDIRNPEGKRFTSKKSAFESLGRASWKRHYREDNDTDEEDDADQAKRKRIKKGKSEEDSQEAESSITEPGGEKEVAAKEEEEEEEEGDPPFRRTGHPYLGRKVNYKHYPQGEDGIEIVQVGVITGWLDSTDVDSNGDPAFISELTGKPGILFHVEFDEDTALLENFDIDLLLEFVDLEQWEVEELFDSK